MEAELVYVSATEAQLNDLLEGRMDGAYSGFNHINSTRLQKGVFGVVAALERDDDRHARPIALIVTDEDQRRLLGRLASLRPELSPLSSWCHLLGSKFVEGAGIGDRQPEFAGMLAAWSGLVSMEASLLSDRAIDKVTLSACLATQSYSMARAIALWPLITIDEVLEKYDSLQLTMRGNPGQGGRLRQHLQPIWATLIALMGNSKVSASRAIDRIIEASTAIIHARQFEHQDETYALARAFAYLPEAEMLTNLSALSPEERLYAFDHVVAEIRASKGGARYNELCFLAAYLATVAAGGKSSIGLAEKLSRELPQILGWVYFIGGLGQKITWSSAFDGLGRLIARELRRPLRLVDGPQCDFALEEALVLLDRQLSDPFVFLKIKQARSVIVALMPGVNVTIPFGEGLDQNRTPQVQSRQLSEKSDARENDALASLADALFPYLKERLFRSTSAEPNNISKQSKGRGQAVRTGGQRKLPLDR
ncbi:hypothetical protein ELH43_36660 [Rhizobium ruizarguesonis]|uniref:hypothetical protein n=1 Tax=Rhizobium ruizarguesonis TaxID=2081791 RepID=UPI00102F4899|nr:hypothetical protein [Rhizobium ruizarguesonis]TBB60673.1 hypothetical protein ELH43_36660 [Rhizobium ruizarguesonis]